MRNSIGLRALALLLLLSATLGLTGRPAHAQLVDALTPGVEYVIIAAGNSHIKKLNLKILDAKKKAAAKEGDPVITESSEDNNTPGCTVMLDKAKYGTKPWLGLLHDPPKRCRLGSAAGELRESHRRTSSPPRCHDRRHS